MKPLKPVWELIVEDEEDLEVLEAILIKYPLLKEFWLKNGECVRCLDARKKIDEWTKWATENWDAERNIPKMELYWRTKASELEILVDYYKATTALGIGPAEQMPSSPQRTLFCETQDEFIASVLVSADQMLSWYKKGWLSFDLNQTTVFDDEERAEVLFIKPLASSGLSDAYIDRLLSAGLDKPYRYDTDETFFHFKTFRWVQLKHFPQIEKLSYSALEVYVDHLVEEEDWTQLLQLQATTQRAIREAVTALVSQAVEESPTAEFMVKNNFPLNRATYIALDTPDRDPDDDELGAETEADIPEIFQQHWHEALQDPTLLTPEQYAEAAWKNLLLEKGSDFAKQWLAERLKATG